MDIQFYIYGTPKGFDLYGGTPNDVPYFQIYYDGSKEKEKLTIHRRNNGLIVYSYLCYDLLDCGGRPGAFFGMSMAANGLYCTDITSLYNLFGEVYKTILKEGVLLKNTNTQTYFDIRTMRDAENEINRVVGILQKNVKTVFSNDFKEVDETFSSNINDGKICLLNPQNGNNDILRCLKEFPMVSISPEYATPTDEPEKNSIEYIDDKDLMLFAESIREIEKENIISKKWSEADTLSKALSIASGQPEIKIKKEIAKIYENLYDEYSSLLSNNKDIIERIYNYLENYPNHQLLKSYKSFFDDLAKQQKEIKTILNVQEIPDKKEDAEIEEEKNDNVTDKNTTETEKIKTKYGFNKMLSFFSFLKKKMPVIIATFVVLILIVGGIFVYKNYESKEPLECVECKDYLDKGDAFLKENKFKEALTEYKKAEKRGLNMSDKIKDVNDAAITFFKGRAESEFNKNETMQLPKIDCYNASVRELKKTEEYGYNPDSDIDDYKQQTILCYKREIKTTDIYIKIVNCANIILTLDLNDIEAKKIIKEEKRRKEEEKRRKEEENNCLIKYQYDANENSKKDWTIDELLAKVENSLAGRSYKLVIDACDEIIKKSKDNIGCVTADQLNKAENFKRAGESMRGLIKKQ
jgi:hypothetical protein